MFDTSKYKFFDYKKFIEGYSGQDFMGICIICYLFVAIAIIIDSTLLIIISFQNVVRA